MKGKVDSKEVPGKPRKKLGENWINARRLKDLLQTH